MRPASPGEGRLYGTIDPGFETDPELQTKRKACLVPRTKVSGAFDGRRSNRNNIKKKRCADSPVDTKNPVTVQGWHRAAQEAAVKEKGQIVYTVRTRRLLVAPIATWTGKLSLLGSKAVRTERLRRKLDYFPSGWRMLLVLLVAYWVKDRQATLIWEESEHIAPSFKTFFRLGQRMLEAL